MVKAKIINYKSNEGVEETKTDPITKKTVHSSEEFAQIAEKKSKVKRDGTIDKRSLKSDVKKDLVMAEMALEIKRLKNDKTDKELKADIKQAKKQEKEDTKQAKILERETKRQDKVNKKQALQQIIQADGKSVKITSKGKIDMRGRTTKCREHQQNIIGTMREALRKSYIDKAKKHIDDEDPEQDFEIVPVPKIELIVQQIEREQKAEKVKEIDYRALYEASLTKTYASTIEQEMASAKRSGTKKRLQQQILKDI
jgi:hypothetical protein